MKQEIKLLRLYSMAINSISLKKQVKIKKQVAVNDSGFCVAVLVAFDLQWKTRVNPYPPEIISLNGD